MTAHIVSREARASQRPPPPRRTAASAGLTALRSLRPPVRDQRFWVIQALVVTVATAHYLVETFHLIPESGPPTFVVESLFVVPIIYAALNFGLRGALATVLWCMLVTIPSWTVLHAGGERVGIIIQMAVLYSVSLFVGTRVDRETRARAAAEQALQALHLSESKYRVLFESGGDGVLAVDRGGAIVECNVAAAALIAQAPADVVGRPASEALPGELMLAVTQCMEAGGGEPQPMRDRECSDVLLATPGGREIWLHPVCTPLPGEGGLTQIVLRDVTEQKRRQSSLETYAEQVLNVQEEERRRIAQELHDDTVQSLVLLCRRLDEIEEESAGAPKIVSRRMRELRSDTEQTIESLRVFLRGLRPSILDDLGLTPAVRLLVTELASRSAIDARFLVSGDTRRRLPRESELALYRIAQEALRNVERHSGAGAATLALCFGDDFTELSVSDDGEGFVMPGPADDLARESKLGLLGMQERARIVGGTLEIRSTPGHGATVVATVPVSRAADQGAREQRATQ